MLDSEKGIADGLLQAYVEPFNDANEASELTPPALLALTRASSCKNISSARNTRRRDYRGVSDCHMFVLPQVLSVLWTRGSVEIERVSARKGWAKPKCAGAGLRFGLNWSHGWRNDAAGKRTDHHHHRLCAGTGGLSIRSWRLERS